MNTRQYIGARYVPKFFDNNGSSDWVANVAYESLTIVTYLGNSYTSKKNVPANIGAPNLNPEYWVSTGMYNEQIEALIEEVQDYREEVEELEQAIDKYSFFKNKRIGIFGDSISSFESTGTNIQPVWVSRLRDHCDSSTSIMNYSQPARRLTGSGGAAGVLSNLDTLPFDIIMIFAGTNDWRHGVSIGRMTDATYDTVWGALNVIRTAVAAKAPNATVYIVSPLKVAEASYPNDHLDYMPLLMYRCVFKRFAENNGFVYIDGFNAPMLNPTVDAYKNLYQPDGLHPINTYTEKLCDYITECMIHMTTGDDSFMKRVTLTDVIANQNFTTRYAYMDIHADGHMEFIASFQGDVAQGNNILATLPEILVPQITLQVPATLSNGEVLPCGISDANGNIVLTAPGNRAVTYNVYATGMLKCLSSSASVN